MTGSPLTGGSLTGSPLTGGSLTGGSLAEQQAALVAALVAGAPNPPGVDPAGLAATRRQLLDKRARVVAGCWPELAATFGPGWRPAFLAWADGRVPVGARLEGLRFAADLMTGTAGMPDQVPAAVGPAAAAMLRQWRDGGDHVVRRHPLLRAVRPSGAGTARRRRPQTPP